MMLSTGRTGETAEQSERAAVRAGQKSDGRAERCGAEVLQPGGAADQRLDHPLGLCHQTSGKIRLG